MKNFLDFEKPINDLETKIEELKDFNIDQTLNIKEELKFHCLNNQVVIIEHLVNGNLDKCCWYDRYWNKLNIK